MGNLDLSRNFRVSEDLAKLRSELVQRPIVPSSDPPIYGRVGWNHLVGSAAQFCDQDGNLYGTQTSCWIDDKSSVAPQVFGNAVYVLEPCGTTAQLDGSTTMQLYRAKRWLTGGTPASTFQVTSVSGGTFARPRDSGGAALQTTLGGAAGDNVVRIAPEGAPDTSFGAVSDVYAAPHRLAWVSSGSGNPNVDLTAYRGSGNIRVHKVAHGVTIGKVATVAGNLAVQFDRTVSPRQQYGDGGTTLIDNLGFVIDVESADYFTLCTSGIAKIISHGLGSAGDLLGLSNSTPGAVGGTRLTYFDEGWQYRPVGYVIDDDTIYVFGPDFYEGQLSRLSQLLDVNFAGSRGAAYPADNDVLTFVGGSRNEWQSKKVSTASLANLAGISVLGRAANSTGSMAAITASTTGDVLQMGASSLQWGQLQTASYADASVTGAKLESIISAGSAGAANYGTVINWDAKGRLTSVTVAQDALSGNSDVSITSVANLDFLQYSTTGNKWKNYSLGPIGYTSGSGTSQADANVFYFGNTGLGTSMNVAVANGSRLLVDVSSSLEWLVRGSVHTTDKWASIRVSSGNLSFQDDGNEVLSWVCSATGSSRLFNFKVPILLSNNQLYTYSTTAGPYIAAGVTNPSIDMDITCPALGALNLTAPAGVVVSATLSAGGLVTSSVGYKANGFTGLASQVVTLAKVTAGGTNGSITVTGGIVTAYTAPT